MPTSLFKNIFQQLLKRFKANMGRAPITPYEWMEVQNAAVRHINKTKGLPQKTTDDPFKGWRPELVETEVKSDDLFKSSLKSSDPKVEKSGKVIDFPIKRKKDPKILLKDSPEDIVRIKRENKEAIKRFKEKKKKDDPDKFQYGGIAPLIGEPSYAANFYDDRTPMKKGNRALTNVQDAFLKMQLANNPEYIAKYFPNVVTEGPSGPLYDVDYQRGKPGNVSYEDGAEFRDVNVPYDTKGSRLNIRATPEQEYIGGMPIRGMKQPGKGIPIPSIRQFPRPDPDYTTYAYMKPEEQFYEGKGITGGQTQAINMAPWILESYGTDPSSPRNEMVNSPEWWTKAGKDFGFETGPTVDQATLNDFIESVLVHETGHGIADKELYAKNTKKATTLDFAKFLTPNQRQSKKVRDFYDVSKMDSMERVRYEYDQEEMFNRMKDIERLKKMYPDSYEKHPLWKLYQNRAAMQFGRITGQKKILKKGFDDYKKKIKPMVDEYFEKIEMKGRGIASINIEKEDIEMPEHLTREETPYVSRARPHEAQGGRVPLGKGKIVKGLAGLIEKLFPGTTKVGKLSKPVAEKTQLKQAIAGFKERQKAAKLRVWENPDKVRAAVDDIFSSGDYKYDAEMASQALVENNPKAFGGKLIDDIDDATRSEIYGAVLRVVQSDLAKTLQLKRLSRPTKTLEGIEKTGTINISDPNVADEFTRFMKESDPKGHKKIEEIVELSNFDPKGKKGHAEGGRIGYSGGGKAGLPAITVGLPQGPAMPGSQMSAPLPQPAATPGGNLMVQNQMQQNPWMGQNAMMKKGIGAMPRPQTRGQPRMPFGLGGFSAARRAFLKMIGAGAATAGAAKTGLFGLLKGSKPVAGTLTQVPIKDISGMPAWFKPLVNRVIKEGNDVTKTHAYKDLEVVHKSVLPDSNTDVLVTQSLDTGDVVVDIGLTKHGFADGKFGQPVQLVYKAEEVIEPTISKVGKIESKGTKTQPEFWVDEAEFTGGHPENIKFEETISSKFGKHESDFSELEAFAKGKKKKTRDISSLQRQNEDLADHFSNQLPPDDFASGGIAHMLGE